MWHVEKKQHIKPEQAAFRPNRSTEDQGTYVSQAIEDAFQDKKGMEGRSETKIEALWSGWTHVQMDWTIFKKPKSKGTSETTLQPEKGHKAMSTTRRSIIPNPVSYLYR